jgi:hypothetical protein
MALGLGRQLCQALLPLGGQGNASGLSEIVRFFFLRSLGSDAANSRSWLAQSGALRSAELRRPKTAEFRSESSIGVRPGRPVVGGSRREASRGWP